MNSDPEAFKHSRIIILSGCKYSVTTGELTEGEELLVFLCRIH